MNFLNKDGLSYFLAKIKELLISKADSTYVESLKQVQEITLGTTWADGLQTVSVPGITENDSPILDVKLSGDFDTVLEQQAEWNKIVQATTGNGTITFLSSEDTTIQLTVLVKGK